MECQIFRKTFTREQFGIATKFSKSGPGNQNLTTLTTTVNGSPHINQDSESAITAVFCHFCQKNLKPEAITGKTIVQSLLLFQQQVLLPLSRDPRSILFIFLDLDRLNPATTLGTTQMRNIIALIDNGDSKFTTAADGKQTPNLFPDFMWNLVLTSRGSGVILPKSQTSGIKGYLFLKGVKMILKMSPPPAACGVFCKGEEVVGARANSTGTSGKTGAKCKVGFLEKELRKVLVQEGVMESESAVDSTMESLLPAGFGEWRTAAEWDAVEPQLTYQRGDRVPEGYRPVVPQGSKRLPQGPQDSQAQSSSSSSGAAGGAVVVAGSGNGVTVGVSGPVEKDRETSTVDVDEVVMENPVDAKVQDDFESEGGYHHLHPVAGDQGDPGLLDDEEFGEEGNHKQVAERIHTTITEGEPAVRSTLAKHTRKKVCCF